MTQTAYELAGTLSTLGYSQSSSPYEDAKSGKNIIVIVSNRTAAGVFQRNIHRRLLEDKNPIEESRPYRIKFSSGGQMLIVMPDEADRIRGLGTANTSYFIYRE